jgi:hypothetical protein
MSTGTRTSQARPVWLDEAAYEVVDTGDPMPDGRVAVVMREHVHYDDAGRAGLRAAVGPVPARPVDRRGRRSARIAAS